MRSRLEAARRARPHAVRGPRGRAGRARRGARRVRRPARPGRGGGRASRGWASRACSGSSPTRYRAHGWLVLEAQRGLLRQGHRATCRSTSCSRRTSSIESGDDAGAIREKVAAQAADARPRASGGPARVPLAARRARWTTRQWHGPRPAQRRQRDARRGQAARRSGRARSSPAPGVRGPALDRLRDPGRSRQPGGEPAAARALVPRELPARVRSTAGAARATTPSSGSTARRPPSADELLDALLGDDPGLDAAQAAADRADRGNPFFLEESVRTLVETGALAGERGAYRLTRAVPTRPGAGDRAGDLAARIDRLPLEDKRLLQTAAVIGKDVPMRAAAGDRRRAPRTTVRRGLDPAPGRRVPATRASLFPELEYTFRHALTHEVAYGSLLQERRRTLHARIVEAIEQLYARPAAPSRSSGSPTTPSAARCGSGRSDYCRQAGGRTLARMASWESVSFFERRPRRARPPPGGRGGARHRRGPPLRSAQRAGPAGPARPERRGAAGSRRDRDRPGRPAAAGPRAVVREQRALGARRDRRGGARGRARSLHRRGDAGTWACRSSAPSASAAAAGPSATTARPSPCCGATWTSCRLTRAARPSACPASRRC